MLPYSESSWENEDLINEDKILEFERNNEYERPDNEKKPEIIEEIKKPGGESDEELQVDDDPVVDNKDVQKMDIVPVVKEKEVC